MTRRKKGSSAHKVGHDAKTRPAASGQFSYLKLPRDISMFKVDKLDDGAQVKFDILPYIVTAHKHPDRNDEVEIAREGDDWYKRPFRVHRGIGSQNERVICPSSVGKKCPICTYRTKRVKDGAEKDETDPLKTSLRNLYMVLPIDAKDYEEKPHIFDISEFCFGDLLSEELKMNNKYWILYELDGGYTLKVRFSKEKFEGNDFAKVSRIDFEERDSVYEESIMEEIPALDDVLNILSYKLLEEKFMELDDEPGPEEDAGSAPPVEEEEEKPKSYRKPKDVEPDEPAADADSEPDEKPKEEEEKPKPKRQAKKEESSEGEENPCPHGHEYGVDAETKKGCDNCDVWEECLEVKTKNEA